MDWVLLNRAPSSTKLHPPPPSSTQLISTFTQVISTSIQLHPPPPSSFQSPPSSLQHPQQYLNQNIARNWEISPSLGQNIKSCPFWLKIDTYGILELILNPDLDFRNSDSKINFWANLGKSVLSESWCTQYLKNTDSKSRLEFWNFDPKIHFWANLGPKIQSRLFCLKIDTHGILRMLIPNPDLDFWDFDRKIDFWTNLDPKSQSCPFCLKIGTHGPDSYSKVSFLNFES